MNKTQLKILWIGALAFLFCLWNPEFVPYTRYDTELKVYTDEEWERELSKYDLSLADTEQLHYTDLTNLTANRLGMKAFLEQLEHESTKNKYIEMLEKGERPHHGELIRTNPTICFEQLFENNLDAFLVRLLSITVLTALLVYSYSDKNKTKLKEILQTLKCSLLSSKPKSGDAEKETL